MNLDVGDVVRITMKFTDPFSVPPNLPVDPGAVVCHVKHGETATEVFSSGTVPAIVREQTGVYHLDYPIANSGRHYVEGRGTGGNAAVEPGFFDVRASRV